MIEKKIDRIYIISDLHASSPIVSGELAVSSHMKALKKTMDFLAERIREDVDDGVEVLLINLGDTLHSGDIVDTYTMSTIWDIYAGFRQILGRDNIITVVGNHDLYSESQSLYSCSFLKGMSIMVEPETHINIICGDQRLIFLPYRKKLSDWKDQLDVALSLSKPQVRSTLLFTHMPVTGALYLSGMTEHNGIQDLKAIHHAYVGHHHVPQMFENITLVGSTLNRDFKDAFRGIHNRIMILDNTPLGFVPFSIRNPHTHYFLRLTPSNENLLKQLAEDPEIPKENLHLRVLTDKLSVNVKGAEVQTIIQKVVVNSGRSQIDFDQSASDIVEQYMKEVPETALDASRLLKTGKGILDGTHQL